MLHWCEWKTNNANYLDSYDKAHKSITINRLNIPRLSRSISIDHNYILLCGGAPNDSIIKINENMSKVFKINLETSSFQTLASMNIGRVDFCMTYLNIIIMF